MGVSTFQEDREGFCHAIFAVKLVLAFHEPDPNYGIRLFFPPHQQCDDPQEIEKQGQACGRPQIQQCCKVLLAGFRGESP